MTCPAGTYSCGMADTLDVVVAGAGSAGLTAALSSASRSVSTLFDVLDEERARAVLHGNAAELYGLAV